MTGTTARSLDLGLLPADTGRPDTAELSRVLIRGLLESAGADVTGLGAPGMRPTHRTTATPRGAAELVPGDAEALLAVADALEELADAPQPELLAQTAAAHRALAAALTDLRSRAEEVYRRSAELGVGDKLWSGGPTLRDRITEHPEDAAELADIARRAAELRLAWDGVQIDFVEDLDEVRESFGIPAW